MISLWSERLHRFVRLGGLLAFIALGVWLVDQNIVLGRSRDITIDHFQRPAAFVRLVRPDRHLEAIQSAGGSLPLGTGEAAFAVKPPRSFQVLELAVKAQGNLQLGYPLAPDRHSISQRQESLPDGTQLFLVSLRPADLLRQGGEYVLKVRGTESSAQITQLRVRFIGEPLGVHQIVNTLRRKFSS